MYLEILSAHADDNKVNHFSLQMMNEKIQRQDAVIEKMNAGLPGLPANVLTLEESKFLIEQRQS